MIAMASLVESTPSSQVRGSGIQPALNALLSSSWFSGFPQATVAALATNASIRSYGARQQIALDGYWAGAAALVVRGSIRAVCRADGSRELTVETFRAGDVFADSFVHGDNALTGDGLVAAETSLLVLLPKEDFIEFLAQVPRAALALAADFHRRLGRVKALAAGLVMTGVENRLYRLLISLAKEDGEAGLDGTVISRSPTQQDLASRIGACRETVSRIVADLERHEMVSLSGRRLTLMPSFFAMAQSAGAV